MQLTSITNKNADALIASRTGFKGSNFAGIITAPDLFDIGGSLSTGRLSQDQISILCSERPSYIVYSYGTPIAWYGTHGWNIPAIKYSQTTSRHQSIVRRSI